MSNPQYAPPGEGPADLWLERSNFAGMFVGGVAYGIHASVFAVAVYFMRGLQTPSARLHWGFLIFISALFVLGTINIACNTKFSQMMWIDDRNIPGGPNAWLAEDYTTPVNIVGNAAYIFSNFLADAMMIYRLWIIWSYNYYILVLPLLSFMASTALSILTIYQTSQPGASLWSQTAVAFAVPYWSLSIALNILVTLIIVYRLLSLTKQVKMALSPSHARTYTSISAMIIESAALYSITGMIFIICYARNSNVQNIVLPILGQVMCIAPELILLRVARGRAWTHQTGTALMSGSTLPGSPSFLKNKTHSRTNSAARSIETGGQGFPMYALGADRLDNGGSVLGSAMSVPRTPAKKSPLADE